MYISITTTSLGLKDLNYIPEIIEKLGANIELSSNHGFLPNKTNISLFKDKLFVHNYSPRPKSPFVLNLASIDEENYHLTEQMIINNIELSQKLSAPYYSLHAGYASDISPSMLGNEITSDAYSSREEIFDLFTKRTKYFSELAAKNNVRLLIENNVAGFRNKQLKKTDLLLLSHVNEIESFFERMYSFCGLLLDVAHLKVSSNNLNFNLEESVLKLSPFVEGLHLSDNEGLEDTNEFFDKEFWILDYLKLFKNLNYIAIETKQASPERIEEMYKLIQKTLV